MNAGVIISTSTNIMLLWDNMQQLISTHYIADARRWRICVTEGLKLEGHLDRQTDKKRGHD